MLTEKNNYSLVNNIFMNGINSNYILFRSTRCYLLLRRKLLIILKIYFVLPKIDWLFDVFWTKICQNSEFNV